MVIECYSLKTKVYTYSLKNVRHSRVEALAPRKFDKEEERPDYGSRMVTIRETGQNNRAMRKYQNKIVSVRDLEECTPPSGPEPVARDFAYVDAIAVRDGDSLDLLFNDQIFVLGVRARSARSESDEDAFRGPTPESNSRPSENLVIVAQNLRTKRTFRIEVDPQQTARLPDVYGLRDFLWIPYGKHNGDHTYFTRVGGFFQEAKNGKFKCLNIVQSEIDINFWALRKHGVDTTLKKVTNMSDIDKNAFVTARLPEQRRNVQNIRQGIPTATFVSAWAEPPRPRRVFSDERIDSVLEQIKPQPAPPLRNELGDACNLRRQCPALVHAADGRLRAKPFFACLPSTSDAQPEHYHLEDADCPMIRGGQRHILHCAYRSHGGPGDAECLLLAPNFPHTCCKGVPALDPETAQTLRRCAELTRDMKCHDLPVDVERYALEPEHGIDDMAGELRRAQFVAAHLQESVSILQATHVECLEVRNSLRQEYENGIEQMAVLDSAIDARLHAATAPARAPELLDPYLPMMLPSEIYSRAGMPLPGPGQAPGRHYHRPPPLYRTAPGTAMSPIDACRVDGIPTAVTPINTPLMPPLQLISGTEHEHRTPLSPIDGPSFGHSFDEDDQMHLTP